MVFRLFIWIAINNLQIFSMILGAVSRIEECIKYCLWSQRPYICFGEVKINNKEKWYSLLYSVVVWNPDSLSESSPVDLWPHCYHHGSLFLLPFSSSVWILSGKGEMVFEDIAPSSAPIYNFLSALIIQAIVSL